MYADELNKLLSSAKKLVSLHTEYFRPEYDLLVEQVAQLDMKSLQLREVHIENPGCYRRIS